MDDELGGRISRIYGAIDAVEEEDLGKLKGQVIETTTFFGVSNDFRGGLSDEEISNRAHSLIHNIANLQDHLKRWARQNFNNASKVDEGFNQSIALQIIKDLSNNDKHGYPTRDSDDGHSGKRPRLIELNRILRLSTKPEKGSSIGMTLNRDGTPRILGSGPSMAIITGTIVDKDDNRIGDLHEFAIESVATWESLWDELSSSGAAAEENP